jgi:hypothetical protein
MRVLLMLAAEELAVEAAESPHLGVPAVAEPGLLLVPPAEPAVERKSSSSGRGPARTA